MEEYAILYRHIVCGKLSASEIILSDKELNNIGKSIERKAKYSRKFCCKCHKYITKSKYIYNTPMYCHKDEVYTYLANDSNLYL